MRRLPMSSKEDFQKLQKKWYKKLEDSGFEDIESDEFNLKTWSSTFHLKHSLETWQAKAEYYQLATNFLEEYKFNSNLDKIIWEYHSNGLGARKIATILKDAKIKVSNRTTIWEVIKKLKSSMYEMYLAPKKEYYE